MSCQTQKNCDWFTFSYIFITKFSSIGYEQGKMEDQFQKRTET